MKRSFPLILLALVALAFIVSHFVWLADMPERLATHFNGAGRANGWMSRQQHSFFMLLTGLGAPVFVLVLSWAIRFLPPTLLNVRKPEYWRSPENYPKACAILFQWAQWQAIGLLVWLTILNRQIVFANHISPPRLSFADMLPLTVGLLMAEAVLLGWLWWRFGKTEREA